MIKKIIKDEKNKIMLDIVTRKIIQTVSVHSNLQVPHV